MNPGRLTPELELYTYKLQQPRPVISVVVVVVITIACEAVGQGDNKYERPSKVAAEI